MKTNTDIMKTTSIALKLICCASLAWVTLSAVCADPSGGMKLNPDVKLVIDGDEHYIRAIEPAVPDSLSPAMKKLTTTKITVLALTNQSAQTVFKTLEKYTAAQSAGDDPVPIIYKVAKGSSITFTARIKNMSLLDSIKYFAQAANCNYLVTDRSVIIYDHLSSTEISRLISENQRSRTNRVEKP
jgi:hypothetical protein